ncbi:WD40 repeat-like protein [Suillus decipiens]|nr:WD40 repeat-like protein [Suillus decipiens]
MVSKLMKHTRRVLSVCFSPDGKRLASRSSNGRVIIWNEETGAILSTLGSPISRVTLCVAFSPDGLKLASDADSNIRVWCFENAELLFNINVVNTCRDSKSARVQRVVWTPDGQQLVSVENENIKFWDSLNGTQMGQLGPHTGYNSDFDSTFAISSDGFFVASASFDLTVRLWDTPSENGSGWMW